MAGYSNVLGTEGARFFLSVLEGSFCDCSDGGDLIWVREERAKRLVLRLPAELPSRVPDLGISVQ